MTHTEKILVSLRRVRSRGACTMELFNEWHIMRVPARIYDLRQAGHVIAKRRCREHRGCARYILVELRERSTDAEIEALQVAAAEAHAEELVARRDDPPEPGEPPDEAYPETPPDEPETAFHTSAVWGDEPAGDGIVDAPGSTDWDYVDHIYESDRDRELEERR